MKPILRAGALVSLLFVACNRPDSALFSDEGLAPGAPDAETGGGGSSSGGSSSDGSMLAGGDVTSGGAPNEMPSATGGTPAKAGQGGGGTATGTGGSATSEPPGAAGAPEGVAGSSEPPQPTEPVCGNGKLEAGEECDDGGHAGKDGCSADCKVTCADFGAGHVESDDHHCYIGYDQADFAGSEAACSMRGAHLATISSEGENKLVHGLVHNSKWLGGMEDVPSTTMGSGAYAWITGEPFTFTNWAPKEPNQAKARCSTSIGTCYEHCLSMLGDGTWADERCDMVDGYVCEWEPAGSQ